MTLLTAVVHQRRVYCRERVDNWFLEEELTAEKTLFNTQQSLIDVNQVYQFWKVHWHQFQMLEKLEKQRCWEVNALACEVTIMWRQCKWDAECLGISESDVFTQTVSCSVASWLQTWHAEHWLQHCSTGYTLIVWSEDEDTVMWYSITIVTTFYR